MHELARAWTRWILEKTGRKPDSVGERQGPVWLLELAAAGALRPPLMMLAGTELIAPDLKALDTLLAGKSVPIGREEEVDTGDYFDRHLKLEDDEASVDGEPFEAWLKRLVERERNPPRQFVAGAAAARARAKYADGSPKDSGNAQVCKAEVTRAPGRAAAPDERPADAVSFSPYVVRVRDDDAERVVLRGWWINSAAPLPDGMVAGLTLDRNEVVLDREHPDIGLTRALADSPGTGPIKAPSNGAIHLVTRSSRYIRGIKIDAENLHRVGDMLVVRRAAYKPGQWGTLVFSCRDDHLVPRAKLDVDIGEPWISDGRIVGSNGYQITRLPEPEQDFGWTPARIRDEITLESPPPPPPDSLELSGGSLRVKLVDASPPDFDLVDPGSHDWLGDPGPTGAVWAGSLDDDNRYQLWMSTSDDHRIESGFPPAINFCTAVTDRWAVAAVEDEAVVVELESGKLDRLTLPGTVKDLEIGGNHLWVLVSVFHADFELYRYDRLDDGWEERDRFPVRGLESILVSPDGRTVALTIKNAPQELAFTLFVALDDDDNHRYLGRMARWTSDFWEADGRLLVRLQNEHTYRIERKEQALKDAVTEHPEPFLALVYDVPKSYGLREFFARWDADFAYLDSSGHLVTRYAYTEAQAFIDGAAVAAFQGGRYRGLIDQEGQVLIPPHYAWIGPADAVGLRRAAVGETQFLQEPPPDGAWGIFNRDQELVVPCTWKDARDPSEGIAILQRDDDSWCVLDESSDVVAEGLQKAWQCQEGVIPFQRDELWGFMSKSGDVLVEPAYGWVNVVTEGRVAVRRDELWFYLSTDTWTPICDPSFDKFAPFRNGFAVVGRDGEWGFLQPDGTLLGEGLAFKRTYNFLNGLAAVQLTDNEWGYVTTDGTVLGQGQGWTRSFNANDGVGVITDKNGKRAYVDADGDIIADGFVAGYGFSEGLAAVKKGERWGFIDTNGEWVVKPTWSNVGQHSEGLARVQLDDKWGFIDRTGELVIPAEFGTPKDFSDGRVAVRRPGA